MKHVVIYFLVFCLFSCSGLQKTEYDKIRKKNITAEQITRKHTDTFSLAKNPSIQAKEPYFWENETQVYLPKITKDFFRCKGHSKNAQKEHNRTQLKDCSGSSKHSLPIIHGKETVYPVLIDILNHVQKKLRQKVVVTCGHRCPTHNMYSEPNQDKSYHMIGAEVDFYVRDLEDKISAVIDVIMSYYKSSEIYKNKKEYTNFQTLEIEGTQAKSFSNKEICIKYHNKDEKRDYDNRHPYPYITIQVKYDRDLKEKITFSSEKAQKDYYKW